MKHQLLGLLLFYFALVLFSGPHGWSVSAQSVPTTDPIAIGPPTSEKFSPASDLLAMWRISKCAVKGKEILGHACWGYGGDEYINSSRATLYNPDGSIWHRLELNPRSTTYYSKVGIRDFIPFATGVKFAPE